MRGSSSLRIGKEVRFIFLEVLMSKGWFKVVVLHFVEAVHVQLSDEAIHFLVSEVAGKDNLLEFYDVFDDELETIWGPIDDLMVILDLNGIRNTPRSSKVLNTKPATSESSRGLKAEES